jgi:hypothetical protein
MTILPPLPAPPMGKTSSLRNEVLDAAYKVLVLVYRLSDTIKNQLIIPLSASNSHINYCGHAEVAIRAKS